MQAKLKSSVLLGRLCPRLRAQDQVAALLLGEQELLVDLKTRQEAVVSTVLDSSLSIFVLRMSPMAAPLSDGTPACHGAELLTGSSQCLLRPPTSWLAGCVATPCPPLLALAAQRSHLQGTSQLFLALPTFLRLDSLARSLAPFHTFPFSLVTNLLAIDLSLPPRHFAEGFTGREIGCWDWD